MAKWNRLFKALSAVLPAGAFGASVLLALAATEAPRHRTQTNRRTRRRRHPGERIHPLTGDPSWRFRYDRLGELRSAKVMQRLLPPGGVTAAGVAGIWAGARRRLAQRRLAKRWLGQWLAQRRLGQWRLAQWWLGQWLAQFLAQLVVGANRSPREPYADITASG